MAKAKTKYTEKDLRKAIEEMNKVLNPEPPLELEDDMELDDLVESFKDGAEMVQKEDKFSDDTRKLAEKLDVEFPEYEGEGKKKDKKKAAPRKAAEKDDYGFRPGCKKSQVMALIKKGKSTMEELVEEFGGQVKNAIKQAEERAKVKVKVAQKSKKVSIDKS